MIMRLYANFQLTYLRMSFVTGFETNTFLWEDLFRTLTHYTKKIDDLKKRNTKDINAEKPKVHVSGNQKWT